MQRWGNARANAYWEAHLKPGHQPPEQQAHTTLTWLVALSLLIADLSALPVSSKVEQFIRSKYESRRWAMEGPLPDPETLDVEGVSKRIH